MLVPLSQSVFVDNCYDLALARGSAVTLKIFHVREDLKVKPRDQETTVSPICAGLQCRASAKGEWGLVTRVITYMLIVRFLHTVLVVRVIQVVRQSGFYTNPVKPDVSTL